MVETNNRRLPVGIQSFEEMRKEGEKNDEEKNI